jgi:hypothetical protein
MRDLLKLNTRFFNNLLHRKPVKLILSIRIGSFARVAKTPKHTESAILIAPGCLLLRNPHRLASDHLQAGGEFCLANSSNLARGAYRALF